MPAILSGPAFVESGTIGNFGAIPGGPSPVAMACDATTAYVVTVNGGAHGHGGIYGFPIAAAVGGSAPELLHSFGPAQASGIPGRALRRKGDWLYGVTRGGHATSGSTVFRFHVGTRNFETIAVLPMDISCVPVSLAWDAEDTLFILTSAAAGPSKSFSFAKSSPEFPFAVNFTGAERSGALFRLQMGGSLELIHTFRPESSSLFRTAPLNLPSEIACDPDGVLYGTTTGRRLFALVPGQPIRWLTENPEDSIAEGPFGSRFTWTSTTAGSVGFRDRRVPLHETPGGLLFHASARATGKTYRLTAGSMEEAVAENWPAELEWATSLQAAGPDRCFALLEADNKRRLVLASSAKGLRPLRDVIGGGVMGAASEDSVIVSDLTTLPGEASLAGTFKRLTLTKNIAPVCTPDLLEGAKALLLGADYSLPDRTPCFLKLAHNDTDAQGDQLHIVAVSQPTVGALSVASDLPHYASLELPSEVSVFEMTATYTVSDGFGGTAQGTMSFRNRAPAPKSLALPHRAGGLTVSASAFATDPDGDDLIIVRVESENMPPWTKSYGGQNATLHPTSLGEIKITVADRLGAEATGMLRVEPSQPQVLTYTHYLIGSSGEHAIETPGFSPQETLVTILKQPQFMSLAVGAGLISYQRDPRFSGDDSFTYTVTTKFGEFSRVTVHLRNALPLVSGTYFAIGSDGKGVARVTVNASGRYTLEYRIGGKVYRRSGDVTTSSEWTISRPGSIRTIRVGLSWDPAPKLSVVVTELGWVPQPLTLYSRGQLYGAQAPRVHAELANVALTPGTQNGRTTLPRSYAVFLRSITGNYYAAGRLADGRPWAASGVVDTAGHMVVGGASISGRLRARPNGNIVGVLWTTLPKYASIMTTVAGSPFHRQQTLANVFGRQQTRVAVRTSFPSPTSAGGSVNNIGQITTPALRGTQYQLAVRSDDGMLSGTISAPPSLDWRPVNGLYIPHKKQVIGFIGESPGAPISIRRQ